MSPPSRAGSACWPTLGELDGLWNFHLERCECATVSARNERRELPFGILMRSRRFFFSFFTSKNSTDFPPPPKKNTPPPHLQKNRSDALEACSNLPPEDEAACMLALGCDALAVHARLDAEEEEEARKKKAAEELAAKK